MKQIEDAEDLLTLQEEEVLDALKNAWTIYLKLPVLHKQDQSEFMLAIHQAQRIIMARPVLWQNKDREDDWPEDEVDIKRRVSKRPPFQESSWSDKSKGTML